MATLKGAIAFNYGLAMQQILEKYKEEREIHMLGRKMSLYKQRLEHTKSKRKLDRWS